MTKKSIIFEKRREAKRLKDKGWSIRKIARHLVCDKDSVQRWLSMDDIELEKDRRGWMKGKMRKYSEIDKRRILELREELGGEGEEEVSVGANLIRQIYRQRFEHDISSWFIYNTLNEYKKKKRMDQDILSYPATPRHMEKQLRRLGNVIMIVDFWTSAINLDVDSQINFLSCRYIYPEKFGTLNRISEFSATEVMRILKQILGKYMRPDIMEMGYHSAFGANLPGQACIGSLTLFLLNLGIKPVYSVKSTLGKQGEYKRTKQVFSSEFMSRLSLGDKRRREFEVEDFFLVYKKPGLQSHDIETRNPFFVKAFTHEDLNNKRVDRFLETDIFFFR